MIRPTCPRPPVLSSLALLLAAASSAVAQQPTFTPYHANGIYDVGEKVGWTVAVPPGAAAPAGPYAYSVRKNNFGDPIKTGTLDLASGPATIEVTLNEPAMLYVQITPPAGAAGAAPARGGRGGLALGAAVAPTRIRPAAARPADFDAFWEAKVKALRDVPMNPVLTPGDSGKPGVEFATFKLDSLGSTAQGYFAKPARDGKFPAIVILQWAGVYALQKNTVIDRASEGWLALNVDAHDKPPGDATGPPGNYQSVGNTDKETSYFLKMYLRDYRAIDYLLSRPEWDGKTLVLMGTSMGGQQSLCLAGLHPKVTHLIVHVPAGCDFSGPAHGHAASYPNWPTNNPAVVETGRYFDAVNFAPRIKATALVSMGFIDTICYPAGIWTAFNLLPGPKEAAPLPEAHHNNFATPQQQRPFTDRSAQWLNSLVKGEPVQPDESAVRPRTPPPPAQPPRGRGPTAPADQPVARADQNSQTAHTQLLEKAKKGRIDVYFVGDSITRRWGATDYSDFLANWKQNFHGWNAANFGWGGDTTQNILWRLHNGELDGLRPKVIVIMAGTNNVGTFLPPGGDDAKAADITKGIKAILDVCRQKVPDAVIVLMGITPRNDNLAVMGTINKINANLARFADGTKVRYLTINDQLADADGKLREGLSPDRLHLSVKAYQVWADALKPILTEILGPPAKEDHAPPPTGDPSAAGRRGAPAK
jgi:cephalosporin-C deacetylase-like acetyl esterase/lysophospholipase L1-like esterase